MIFNRLKNIPNYEEFVKDLDTGDILLYQTSFWYSRLIEYFTKCPYSHISIVLKNPTWLSDELKEDFYLLESGGEVFPDAVSGKYLFGVQIAPLRNVYEQYAHQNYGHLYVRKLEMKEKSMGELQKSILESYRLIRDKPYDIHPIDWINSYFDLSKPLDKIKGEERTDCFWCSALVSFIYCKCGFLDNNIPWTIIAPSDYCYLNHRLNFKNCSLLDDLRLI